MAMLVGAVAISRSIHDDRERRRLLAAAQNQILMTLGVAESRPWITAEAGR